ncbi:MAG: OmpH family outer membrane protein [Terriglobia bacterium]
MKNRLIVFAALLSVLAPVSLCAQGATPAQGKIGVINMQGAIANTAEGKKVIADLQKKYQPRQQELQRLQQEIQAIQDQLSKQAATLSDEEQARLNRDAEEKQKLLKRSAEDAQNDFNRDRDEVINKVGQKMLRVISDYAQQNGFTLVLDDGQIPIYFAAKDIEITEEIIKRYDAANPVADAAASPAKPAAHPAMPAPK